MAVTFTGAYSVFGDRIVAMGDATLTDLTSGGIALPGLSRIDAALVCTRDAASAGVGYTINANSAGSAVNGSLLISSASANGVYSVFALGR
jgi:hypothetical protein